MRLRQLGEFALIERLRRRHPAGRTQVRLGIGDDAAVLRPSPGCELVVTSDMLVEGIDFDLSTGVSFDQIGYKSMAANLSDVAAMGARPVAFLVDLAAPGSTAVDAIEDFYRGLDRLARRHGLTLIGGDLSRSPQKIFISLAVLGEVGIGRAVRRRGARIGDHLYVTGSLGDSRAGLQILKRRRSKRPAGGFRAALLRRHLYPTVRLPLGRLLGERGWARCMIDLSDGLASDLRHLCEAGRVGARLELDRLPISPSLRAYAGRSAAEFALKGGEDFELLFSVAPKNSAAVRRAGKRLGVRLTCIGRIVSRKRGIALVHGSGRVEPLLARGYEHFKASPP